MSRRQASARRRSGRGKRSHSAVRFSPAERPCRRDRLDGEHGFRDVARGWAVSALNTTIVPRVFRVFAICAADAAPTTPAGVTARCAGLKATIAGTAGPDKLVGTPGPDVIAGLGGNDVIRPRRQRHRLGGGGNDTSPRRARNDRLYGELGNDILNGGPGNDLLVGGPGVDRLIGGTGTNAVRP